MSDPVTIQTAGVAAGGEVQETTAPGSGKPRSLWQDAWAELRKQPLFWISLALLAVFIVMAIFPQLFTGKDPAFAELRRSLEPPSAAAWFGYDLQGRDVYARTIYGARASVVVGVLTTVLAVLVGVIMGVIGGFAGGWVDSLTSRIGEIFIGVPYLLGAILILSTVAPAQENPGAVLITAVVIIVLSVLSWPIVARIARSSLLSVKHADYVLAARALGASPGRIIFRHLLPNSLAPIIVVATISMGSYISAEATLSFLGVGLRAPVISWGIAIADHTDYLRTALHAMLFPSIFLSVCVLAFVMLGDAVRSALDPKLR
ncbi:ABC transporter permease [Rhizohabitans arisaemae]|uniref:ABC transporter permease n=1 Tax=Rhizohabitans arisaemae TaxID=2720610 RepID=UPI0024B244F1|nr:ABC transporter permease [Rhizohabitans arisaemae]